MNESAPRDTPPAWAVRAALVVVGIAALAGIAGFVVWWTRPVEPMLMWRVRSPGIASSVRIGGEDWPTPISFNRSWLVYRADPTLEPPTWPPSGALTAGEIHSGRWGFERALVPGGAAGEYVLHVREELGGEVSTYALRIRVLDAGGRGLEHASYQAGPFTVAGTGQRGIQVDDTFAAPADR